MKTQKLVLVALLLAGAGSLAADNATGLNARSGQTSVNPSYPGYSLKKKPVDSAAKAKEVDMYVNRRAKRWSVGLGGGPTFFFGDADKIQPSWHIRPFVKYSISHTLGMKFEYNWGKLRGARDFQSPTNFKDNFKFKSNIQDWNLQMVYTLGNISFLRPLRKTQMYLFMGVGQLNYKSTATFIDRRQFVGGDYYLDHYFGKGSPNPNLGKEVQEKREDRNTVVPMGVGFKHNLSRLIDIGVEYRNTWTRTDDIDVYNTPIWQNRWWDYYSMMDFNIAFKLGQKGEDRHYDWINPVQSIYERITTLEEKVDTLMADKDKDGVSDFFDVDPTTPDTCHVYGNGLAIDSDYDGIPDCQDEEPFSEKGAKVDDRGKMVDSDGDGVPDHRDQEPNTPKGMLVDVGGRQIKNNCCNCEDPVFPSVYFQNGKCAITPEMEIALYEIANRMKQCPDKKLVVCGSNDAGKKYTKKGGANDWCRANTIIETLVNVYGISRDRFIIDPNCVQVNKNKVEVRFGRTGETGSSTAPSAPRSSR